MKFDARNLRGEDQGGGARTRMRTNANVPPPAPDGAAVRGFGKGLLSACVVHTRLPLALAGSGWPLVRGLVALPFFAAGRVQPSTATTLRSVRWSERSSARALPIAFRSAQRLPVGMETSRLMPT